MLHRFVPLLLLALAGCESARTLRHTVLGATPHERYASSLRDAGLDETAIGRAWVESGARALALPARIDLPFRETGYFAADEPGASGYRFGIPRGQRVTISVDVLAEEPVRVFIDLFEAPATAEDTPRHLASAETGALSLEYEPRRSGELIVRVQPELLRAVRFSLDVRTGATLAFPVHGRDTRAVGSRFGDSRDGGRREHHGLDIFAPRGTPVLAASDGVVRRVGINRLGGNVVWLSDASRGLSHYYAHLDTQLVTAGVRVRAGDTIGLVGNSGNARTTPPHLHFGLYVSRQGPVDPWHFVYESRQAPAPVSADTARLGGWSRSRVSQPLILRAGPSEGSPAAASLVRHTPMRVLGASGAWFRVELPDGATGYVIARSTEAARAPIARQRFASSAPLLDRPGPSGVAMDSISAGETHPVLARFGGYVMVGVGSEGRTGWVME